MLDFLAKLHHDQLICFSICHLYLKQTRNLIKKNSWHHTLIFCKNFFNCCCLQVIKFLNSLSNLEHPAFNIVFSELIQNLNYKLYIDFWYISSLCAQSLIFDLYLTVISLTIGIKSRLLVNEIPVFPRFKTVLDAAGGKRTLF